MWGFGWIEVSLTIIFNDVLWNNSSQVGMAIGIKKGEKWRPICKILFVIVFFSAKDSICLHKCTLIYNLFFYTKWTRILIFCLAAYLRNFPYQFIQNSLFFLWRQCSMPLYDCLILYITIWIMPYLLIIHDVIL